MMQTDINMVPLVADRFNDCKSAIRFLDAALVGVPTIASRVGDFVNVIAQDRTGIFCEGEYEWVERLGSLSRVIHFAGRLDSKHAMRP